MAKKAKRRGRPPGSKNKTSLSKVARSVSKMDIGQLPSYIPDLEETLAARAQQQKEYLEGQLAGLKIYANNKAGAVVRAVMRLPNTGRRKKPKPKYQSKKNPKLKWTGRGMLPVWMREEMKGTRVQSHKDSLGYEFVIHGLRQEAFDEPRLFLVDASSVFSARPASAERYARQASGR